MRPVFSARMHFLLAFALAGCGASHAPPSNPETVNSATDVSGVDVGDVGAFHSCNAQARRLLSPREERQIEILRLRCTPSADCLVSCIASPNGHQTGGGCAHVCFDALHAWNEYPESIGQCDDLESGNEG